MTPLVQLERISKRFGKIQANDHVSVTVEEGRIHGLIGGNGAGKSTLMKILYGIYQPDSGDIFFWGKPVRISHPRDAIHLGMGMLHQDFLLIENMNAVENIILGAEIHRYGIINYHSARKKIEELSSRFHLDCDFNAPVTELSVGVRQRVEIIKLLFREANILILDEPTGILVPHEVDSLFEILRLLKESGSTIIFVSHKLHEVMTICDTISVMRDGQLIFTEDTKKVTVQELVEKMTGKSLPQLNKQKTSREKKPQFKAQDITVTEKKRPLIENISFTINTGETLGIAGIEGNGQKELEEALIGLRQLSSGTLTIAGKMLKKYGPSNMLHRGMGYIPSNRQDYGMIGEFSLAENLILGWHTSPEFSKCGMQLKRSIQRYAGKTLLEYYIVPSDTDIQAQWLSGGNQQKLVIARVLSRKPSYVIACHPTRGVSIHDSHLIWQRLLEYNAAGAAILLISNDLTELFTMCDRIAVIFKGKIVAEIEPQNSSPSQLGRLMVGAELQNCNCM